MNTVVSFIIVLGLLIFVHELGHFLFAKLFKVKVLKFSLGFGPKIFGRTVGETEYLISAFPLGGYVKMLGENPDEQEVETEDQCSSFAHKSVWKRFFIVLAGPVFNLVFALVLFCGLFIAIGVPDSQDTTTIGQVSEKSPAAEAGLLVGDTIEQINGIPVIEWLSILNSVKDSEGKPLTLQIKRGTEQVTVVVTPAIDSVKNVFGEVTEKRYMIGVMKAEALVYEKVGVIRAIQEACAQTWMYISLTVMGFVKLVQRVVPMSELGGPILIAQLAGQQMAAGWIHLVYFIALLSVNLGILNLLPIPVLDGGHLVFLGVEAVRRRPLSERVQIVAQQVGMALLGSLMLFVFYNDLVRIFTK
ncbi:MAG: RIP metalloprotease RseP [Proteobacteria bacterium]|jgi:regulator of sigma E protease|nr:RIP metalloprotease RseP [Desulfocapsa sp.]MBU3943544.1 RIP metalloprotease RseP [Pseudomonadota bacterium]MCG2743432.1 RIP metalloprotease RseP [Desulfobacteraceae bacterium]MBU3982963.1 RIP metalloprotease RseP [Pseudomonadota bacterium]MBU4028907.1 RIP metalloprotease RseP [Pseudomonadota bacterium]